MRTVRTLSQGVGDVADGRIDAARSADNRSRTPFNELLGFAPAAAEAAKSTGTLPPVRHDELVALRRQLLSGSGTGRFSLDPRIVEKRAHVGGDLDLVTLRVYGRVKDGLPHANAAEAHGVPRNKQLSLCLRAKSH